MMPELTYREAIRLALAEEMRRDPTILFMGEDVAAPGGIFKITEGLLEEFGSERVRDTPISETAFVGAALGLAVTGYRPVVALMGSDFLGVCFGQIVGSLPFPGRKIVAASSPAEADGMLKAAIRYDNRVVVIEHKGLLGEKGPVREGEDGLTALDGPAVVRPGDAATVVASLAMVPRARAAADMLAGEGVEAEIMDLRGLRPLNVAPIVESLGRTGRLVLVEEQHRLGGWGAQVIAEVVEKVPGILKAPPRRVTLPDHPLPFSPVLEDAALPSAERIAGAVREVL